MIGLFFRDLGLPRTIRMLLGAGAVERHKLTARGLELMGDLSDERRQRLREVHDMYGFPAEQYARINTLRQQRRDAR